MFIKGQLALELLIALGIFTISMAAAFQLFFGGQSLSIDSANATLASDYAQEGMEAARTIRDRNWSELTNGDHGLVFTGTEWQFSGASDNKDIFSRKISIATGANDNVKTATTTITWQTDPLRPQKIELVEQFANWQNPSQGACKLGPLSGNWQSPVSLGTGDLGSGNEGSDIAVKLPYVYVSGTASSASKPDIFVFNVSNPASPSLVASLNIGSNGINSIFIKGNYLYAASPNDSKELIIFDISTPASISEIGSLNLSGTTDAISIAVFSNTVAIGRKGNSGNELYFIDVTNPALPSLISSFEVGGDVNDLTATGDKLYSVSGHASQDIGIFDITNPGAPSLVTYYNLQDGDEDESVGFQSPGNILVGNEANKFFILGATTTSQIYSRASFNTGGGVVDMVCVAGDLVFLATSNSTKEFLILNIANPDNPVEYGSINFPQIGTGIDFADNKVFMSVRSNDSLRIITSTP